MNKLTGKWEVSKSKYVSGESMYLGNIKVSDVFYDGITSQSNTKKYKCKIFLPGINFKKESYETIDQAKEFAERAVNLWLSRAGLI